MLQSSGCVSVASLTPSRWVRSGASAQAIVARLMVLGAPETIVSAQLGHRKRTQTQQYIEVTPAMLRPWVEQWAGLVLGESKERAKVRA